MPKCQVLYAKPCGQGGRFPDPHGHGQTSSPKKLIRFSTLQPLAFNTQSGGFLHSSDLFCMASHVVVLDSSARRAVIKTTPAKHLADVLQEACIKLGLDASRHGLKYGVLLGLWLRSC